MLYPLIEFTSDFQQTLDEYFDTYRDVVSIVHDVTELATLRPPATASPEQVLEHARLFLDTIAPA